MGDVAFVTHRPRDVRARTINLRRLPKRHLRLLREDDPGIERPRKRGECAGIERPCPWVGCKHNLYLDVSEATGSIKMNFPDLEPDQMTESCALDVADRGGYTLQAVGAFMNVTRERIRQLEVLALKRVRRRAEHSELGEMTDARGEIQGSGFHDGIGLNDEIERPREEDAERDEPEREEEGVHGPVWDLSIADTPARVAAAVIRCMRAHRERNIARGVDARGSAAKNADSIIAECDRINALRTKEEPVDEEKSRSKIQDLLRERGPLNGAVIREELGLTKAACWKVLRFLREAGELVMDGEKRGATWRLPSQKPPADGAAPARVEKPARAKKARRGLPPPRAKRATSNGNGASGSLIDVLEHELDVAFAAREQADKRIAVLQRTIQELA